MEFHLRRRGRPFDPRYRFVTGFRQPQRLLDLGCGSGENCIDFRSVHREVELEGCDIERRKDLPDFIRYFDADLNLGRLECPDGHFDAVMLTHVIEHLRTPTELGREIARVLRPGGAFYVETPNWTSMLVPSFGFRREQSTPFNFFDDPTHIKPWSKHGLYDFIKNVCGLEVEAVGARINWARWPTDPAAIAYWTLRGNRGKVIHHFMNFYGWAIFGVGVKPGAVRANGEMGHPG